MPIYWMLDRSFHLLCNTRASVLTGLERNLLSDGYIKDDYFCDVVDQIEFFTFAI